VLASVVHRPTDRRKRVAAAAGGRRRFAGRLAGIPGVLIHGHFDIGGPPDVPWLLAKAWPAAQLHLVRAGHMGGDDTTNLMITALDAFR